MSWPVGISQRPACRTLASRSRSAGPSGPWSVCTVSPSPDAALDGTVAWLPGVVLSTAISTAAATPSTQAQRTSRVI